MSSFLIGDPNEARSVLGSYCFNPKAKLYQETVIDPQNLFEALIEMLSEMESTGLVEDVGFLFHSKMFYRFMNLFPNVVCVYTSSLRKGHVGQIFEHAFFSHVSLPENAVFVLGEGEPVHVGHLAFELQE